MEIVCSQYYSALNQLCPSLIPFLSPRLPPHLSSLNFHALEEANKSPEGIVTSCEFCGYESADLLLQFDWIPNFFSHSLLLSDIKFGCRRCSALRNFDSFLELSLCSPQDEDGAKLSELRTLMTHFAKANKLLPSGNQTQQKQKADTEISFSALTYYIQQAYSLAFHLKIALSNLPVLRLIDRAGNDLQKQPENYINKLIDSALLAKKSKNQNINRKTNQYQQETQKGKRRERTESDIETDNQTTENKNEQQKVHTKNNKKNNKEKKGQLVDDESDQTNSVEQNENNDETQTNAENADQVQSSNETNNNNQQKKNKQSKNKTIQQVPSPNKERNSL
eukprot:TRINITY_DN2102_c0_g1_i1.p1 TRINITY_DN2102_c0_g1~~TRINITY_DN2102_c0_g1_i1.p1  ORF type:complete len:336 (-),score=71.96 TRINITY_DN2102_c0_g1_i1:296-1303(-)